MSAKKTQEVAVVEKKPATRRKRSLQKKTPQAVSVPVTMEQVFLEAIRTPDLNPANLEKLVELKERLDAKEAEKAFHVAMAQFQGAIDVIIGTKDGSKTSDGIVAFKYAPREQIMRVIRKPLSDAGLSVTFKSEITEKIRKTTCKVTHIMGHSDSASFESERGDGTTLMSNLQKHSATLEHHERYALKMALNIVTEGEDDENQLKNKNGDGKKQQAKKNGVISAGEVKRIENEIGSGDEVLYRKVTKGFKIDSLAELKKVDFKDCLQRVKEYKQAKAILKKDKSKS